MLASMKTRRKNRGELFFPDLNIHDEVWRDLIDIAISSGK
jgi:hypothetical protein